MIMDTGRPRRCSPSTYLGDFEQAFVRLRALKATNCDRRRAPPCHRDDRAWCDHVGAAYESDARAAAERVAWHCSAGVGLVDYARPVVRPIVELARPLARPR